MADLELPKALSSFPALSKGGMRNYLFIELVVLDFQTVLENDIDLSFERSPLSTLPHQSTTDQVVLVTQGSK